MAGIWKSIKKVRRGSRAARMVCAHLQGLGVDARMIEEEGNQIALTDQEIDVIEVHYAGANPQLGPAHYSIYYGVRCDLEGVEKQFWVRGRVKTRGLFRREVVDFKWEGKGRELADALNSDGELKGRLLQQRKVGEGARLVDLSPDKKAGVVWITTVKYLSPFPKTVTPFQIPSDLMPSETSLQLYNAIARHIRHKIDSIA